VEEGDLMPQTTSLEPARPAMTARVGRLREALADKALGRELYAQLLPAHIARTGQDTMLDFSDWSQFSQWPQSS
jgi:hypothetical protein